MSTTSKTYRVNGTTTASAVALPVATVGTALSTASSAAAPLGRAYPYEHQDWDARRAIVTNTLKQLEAQHWSHVIAYELADHQLHVLTGQREGESPKLMTKPPLIAEYRVTQRATARAHMLRLEREMTLLRSRFAEYLVPETPEGEREGDADEAMDDLLAETMDAVAATGVPFEATVG